MNKHFVSITDLNWWWILAGILLFTALRYFSLAGMAYLFIYRLGIKYFKKYKIQTRFPVAQQVKNELYYSVFTIIVFTLVGCVVYSLYSHGYTSLYTTISAHSKAYLILSFTAMILVHDTYFYWTHRLLHTKWLFKKIHFVHHRSVNPTPWTAYAFHPAEALIQSLVTIPLVTIFPVYTGTFLLFTFFVLFTNVMGHLGFEFFPKGIRRSSLGKLLTWSTHHNLHHQKSKKNFAYYFTCWDSLMHTLYKDSDSHHIHSFKPQQAKHEKNQLADQPDADHKRRLLPAGSQPVNN